MWTIPLMSNFSKDDSKQILEHSTSLPLPLRQKEVTGLKTSNSLASDLFAAMNELQRERIGLKEKSLGLKKNLSNVSKIKSSSIADYNWLIDSLAASLCFEILYIGKIKVSHSKAPYTFIDDALDKFNERKLEKEKALLQSQNVKHNEIIGNNKKLHQKDNGMYNSNVKKCESKENMSEFCSEKSKHVSGIGEIDSNVSFKMKDDSHDLHNCEPNRTLLLQIGKNEIYLISPDKKSVLLCKNFCDVSHCCQGIKNQNFFGIICREYQESTFLGYIFQCQSASVAEQVLAALNRSFIMAHNFEQEQQKNCEKCPLNWFQSLTSELEGICNKMIYIILNLGLPVSNVKSTLMHYLNLLPEEERKEILEKFEGAHSTNLEEQNKLLLMLIHAHLEIKMANHIHGSISDTSHNFPITEDMKGALLKAKRSLTNSFDQLLKRREARDSELSSQQESVDIHHLKPGAFASKIESVTSSKTNSLKLSTPSVQYQRRPRSRTISSSERKAMEKEMVRNHKKEQLKPPIRNIFTKTTDGSHTDYLSLINLSNDSVLERKPSLRLSIFNRVQTPLQLKNSKSSIVEPNICSVESKKHSSATLRALWKKAILQQILLIRMEKQNKKLQVHQEETIIKHVKLDYQELGYPICQETEYYCDMLIYRSDRLEQKFSRNLIADLLCKGIPKNKRGDVWLLLLDQNRISGMSAVVADIVHWDTPYEELLKDLTSSQHSILLDLGRTFPNHRYFAQPMGSGQLSLFNLLKAYSLLDSEVGYCQGLSFVAGILLLHMSEREAYLAMKHLLFELGLREQYRPDMTVLQKEMYQLSRLVHDHIPSLYFHLDRFEIPPTLYAAPWFLTIFASQFPIGFVVRAFDMLFLYGLEAIYRIALALLKYHANELMKCDGLESTMDYFRTDIPNVGPAVTQQIFHEAYNTVLAKELQDFEVEYQVLKEEMADSPKITQRDIQKMQTQITNLKKQNLELLDQLQFQLEKSKQLEKELLSSNSYKSKLELRLHMLDSEIITIKKSVSELLSQIPDSVDIPEELHQLKLRNSDDDLLISDTLSRPSKTLQGFHKHVRFTLYPEAKQLGTDIHTNSSMKKHASADNLSSLNSEI